MPNEVLTFLNPRPGGVYLDGTVGGGGHARLVLEASAPAGRLIGLDQDQDALARARTVLAPYGDRARLVHANFSEAPRALAEAGIPAVDGILLDLGVSSYQLDEGSRGFSFRTDAPLDMRMDASRGETAAEVVALAAEQELARIFREYGEERWARRIARKIVTVRQKTPLATTRQLAELIRDTVPGGNVPGRIHPATRVFQALRIHVNRELDHLARALQCGVEILKPEGRFVIISFHSLEDRMVKRFFQEESRECICPPRVPICTCNHQPRLKVLTRKAVRATEAEVTENPRARSAILRAACRRHSS